MLTLKLAHAERPIDSAFPAAITPHTPTSLLEKEDTPSNTIVEKEIDGSEVDDLGLGATPVHDEDTSAELNRMDLPQPPSPPSSSKALRKFAPERWDSMAMHERLDSMAKMTPSQLEDMDREEREKYFTGGRDEDVSIGASRTEKEEFEAWKKDGEQVTPWRKEGGQVGEMDNGRGLGYHSLAKLEESLGERAAQWGKDVHHKLEEAASDAIEKSKAVDDLTEQQVKLMNRLNVDRVNFNNDAKTLMVGHANEKLANGKTMEEDGWLRKFVSEFKDRDVTYDKLDQEGRDGSSPTGAWDEEQVKKLVAKTG